MYWGKIGIICHTHIVMHIFMVTMYIVKGFLQFTMIIECNIRLPTTSMLLANFVKSILMDIKNHKVNDGLVWFLSIKMHFRIIFK